jgi:hypothetical protein
VVHDEADGAGARGREHHRVDEADVVAHQHRRARGRDALGALHAQPVHAAREHQGHEAQQVLRHEQEDVQRHQRVEQRHHEEDLRDGEPGRQQRRAHEGAGDHEEGVEDVVGSDDAGAVRGAAAHLDERVHRHAVQARGQRQQGEVRRARASARAGRGRRPPCRPRRAAGRLLAANHRSTENRLMPMAPSGTRPISTWPRLSISHSSAPVPMPSENTTSSSEATRSSPCMTSRAKLGK